MEYFKILCFCLVLIAITIMSIYGLTIGKYKVQYGKMDTKFITVEETVDEELNEYKIKYDKQTKVKYLFWFAGYKGGVTPLYNADGTLQLYTEEEQ